MAPAPGLESWVSQQYYDVGLNRNGQYIGQKKFKQMLFNLHPGHKMEIRAAVNKVIFDGKVRQINNSPKPASPKPSVVTRSMVAKTDPSPSKSNKATKKQSSGAFTMKVPSQRSSDSGSYSESSSSSPTKDTSTNGGSTSQRGAFPAESHKPSSATLDSENGGVIIDLLGKSSISEPSASSQKVKDLQNLFGASTSQNARPSDSSANQESYMTPNLDDQLGLLHLHDDADLSYGEAATEDIKNAVLFSSKLLEHYEKSILPQYGLLGSGTVKDSSDETDPRIFLNTNIPFSAFVCGVQGSGKSHTTSCLIENCLIRAPILGVLQKPLSALVFHYDEAASHSNFKPSEVAFLASSNPKFPNQPRVSKINVLVSPSNFLTLKPLYTQIPGVTVQPFKLPPKTLKIGTMLTLMSVDTSESAPLYMSQVTKILRDMASKSSKAFDYLAFKHQLAAAKLDRKQIDFLNQRLDLLESFLDLQGSTPGPPFEAGTITIIDLSCPFVDVNTACVLFKIGMGMYLESSASTGKLIAVDEAHKYITPTLTPASTALTDALLSTIRQQRHHGVRVIISTQEPTISPRLIDLCSITVIHRFSSPEWFSVLRRHISIFDDGDSGAAGKELFQVIVGLRTGEALMFAPTGVVGRTSEYGDGKDQEGMHWRKLSEGMLKVMVRKRVTWDGGRSVVAV